MDSSGLENGECNRQLLAQQDVCELVRFEGQIVSTFQVLILQSGAGLHDVAADLRNRILLVVAEGARQAVQVLLSGIQQLRCALLCLRRR